MFSPTTVTLFRRSDGCWLGLLGAGRSSSFSIDDVFSLPTHKASATQKPVPTRRQIDSDGHFFDDHDHDSRLGEGASGGRS
ncbi:hypothetical protein L596_025182 [Steinernema carpocapsae]|uniref:Uncharacterized protein n=1 Tax=Steinernema carpocapsae TaxID=34508 RepID=A0A4U5M778_STECR|nr:hypothetical protein L596_025182 [Steinernema carpocapsae]